MKILTLFVGLVVSECPQGWSHYQTNSKCYKAFESGEETAWTLAESTCQKFGADLTSFENEGEKNFVYEKVRVTIFNFIVQLYRAKCAVTKIMSY